MGTRCGTKTMCTGFCASALRTSSISGLCRWAAILYALNDSLTSQWWTVREGERPAPLTPDLESTTMVVVSIIPDFTTGIRGRSVLVG